MLESHAVFFIQAYAASFFLGQTSPLLHGAAFFTLLCFFAHPRSKFANQTLWSTKDFVKLLFSGHHAHSMVMHVNIMAWHYIGTVTFMLATGLPFDTIWRADLALDVRVLCGKTAVHRLGPKLPPARPAGARQSSGRPPTSGSLGQFADPLWPPPTGLHFSTQALVFTKHFAVQLYTCFEYRSFIAQNYGHFGNHLAFVICASMPGRILRCFARPASTLKVCLEVPGLLYALAPRELTATAQTRKLPQEVLPLNLASVAHSPLRTCRVGLQRCALLAVGPAVAPRVSTCVDTLPACSRAPRAHVCSRRPHAFSIDAPSHAAGQPWAGPWDAQRQSSA